MPFNDRVGSQVGNDVRGHEIMKELQRMAELFGRDQWSIFEIFTLITKAAEMGIEHAKAHKVNYPRELTVTAADGTKITLSCKAPTSKAQLEQAHFNGLVDKFGKPN